MLQFYLIASSFYVIHFFILKKFLLLFILTFKCPYNPLPPSLSITTQFKYVQNFKQQLIYELKVKRTYSMAFANYTVLTVAKFFVLKWKETHSIISVISVKISRCIWYRFIRSCMFKIWYSNIIYSKHPDVKGQDS